MLRFVYFNNLKRVKKEKKKSLVEKEEHVWSNEKDKDDTMCCMCVYKGKD